MRDDFKIHGILRISFIFTVAATSEIPSLCAYFETVYRYLVYTKNKYKLSYIPV